MSLNVTSQSILQVGETLEGNAPFASSKTVTHSALNQSVTMAADTTPPVTKYASKQLALIATAATIDLAALTGWGTNGADVNATGLKLQELRVFNPATNAKMTLEAGASNGYEAFGPAFVLDVFPGAWYHFHFDDETPDVGPTAKTIDVTGTGTEVLSVEMLFG